MNFDRVVLLFLLGILAFFVGQMLGLIGGDPMVMPTPAPVVITIPVVMPEATPPAFSLPTAAALPVQAPVDTTDQAAAVYASNPQLVEDCMRAAVENRRSSPACTEVLRALGSGR